MNRLTKTVASEKYIRATVAIGVTISVATADIAKRAIFSRYTNITVVYVCTGAESCNIIIITDVT